MPKPYWQRLALIRIVCLVVWAGAVLCLIFVPSVGFLFYFLLALAALAWWAVCPRIVYARMKRLLAENDNLLCLNCAYSLKGLPEEHACPECGTKFTADEVRIAWKRWAATGKLPDEAIT